MLAHGSTAQFSIWFFGSATKWLDHHVWAGIVAGAMLLAMAIVGPELIGWAAKQSWAVKLKLPRTPGERLKLLEAHAQCVQTFIGPNPPLGFSQLGLRVDHNRLDAKTWFNGLRDRMDKAEMSLDAYRQGMVALGDDFSEWKTKCVNTANHVQLRFDSLRNLQQYFEHHTIGMHRVTTLISDYSRSKEYLMDIRERHPQSEATNKPFCKPWWDTRSTQTEPLVVEWAAFHKHLAERCNSMVVQDGMSGDDVTNQTLRAYAQWANDDPMDSCLLVIGFKVEALQALQRRYAAELASFMSVKDAKS